MKKRGINHDDTQSMNRGLILALLKENPQLSRSDLADMSGLRPATISNIVSDLIAAGLVEEAGTMHSGVGRRPIELRLISDGIAFLIFNFSVPNPTLSHVSLGGGLQYSTGLSRESAGAEAMADCIVGHASELQGKVAGRIHAIGVVLTSSQQAALGAAAAAHGYPNPEDWLGARAGIDTYLATDIYVCALAAWSARPAHSGPGPIVYIAPGEEVEAAVYGGGDGSPRELVGGFLGHLCINFNGPPCGCGARGCLNLYASTAAIRRDIEEKRAFHQKSMLPPEPTAGDIASAFHRSDPLARSAVTTAAGFLAIGLSGVIRLLRPSEILLGGDALLYGEEYLGAIRRFLQQELPEEPWAQVAVGRADDSSEAKLHGMYDFVSARSMQEIVSAI